jgi:hypothetical protein
VVGTWFARPFSRDSHVAPVSVADTELVVAVGQPGPAPEADDAVVSGRVTNADSSNLFPRRFDLTTRAGRAGPFR